MFFLPKGGMNVTSLLFFYPYITSLRFIQPPFSPGTRATIIEKLGSSVEQDATEGERTWSINEDRCRISISGFP